MRTSSSSCYPLSTSSAASIHCCAPRKVASMQYLSLCVYFYWFYFNYFSSVTCPVCIIRSFDLYSVFIVMAGTVFLAHFDQGSISNTDIYMRTHENVHSLSFSHACQLTVDFLTCFRNITISPNWNAGGLNMGYSRAGTLNWWVIFRAGSGLEWAIRPLTPVLKVTPLSFLVFASLLGNSCGSLAVIIKESFPTKIAK